MTEHKSDPRPEWLDDFEDLANLITEATEHRRDTMKHEFETRLNELMTETTSPREIIEESENLRREYEQD